MNARKALNRANARTFRQRADNCDLLVFAEGRLPCPLLYYDNYRLLIIFVLRFLRYGDHLGSPCYRNFRGTWRKTQAPKHCPRTKSLQGRTGAW